MKLNAESVAWAIELANRVRREKGEVLLRGKLPYSQHVGIAGKCVLARAFNFDCEVAPFDYFGLSAGDLPVDSHWCIRFQDKSVAKILANALSHKVVSISDEDRGCTTSAYINKQNGHYVPLPDEITTIAETFDHDPAYLEEYMEIPTVKQMKGLE